MRVRFQADADLNLAILLGLQRREPSIDFQTAVVADLANRHDLEVLEIAAAEGRLLVTHGARSMTPALREDD